MGVASLVIDDGGDEDEAIAALLHDAVEDQGGEATLGGSASNSATASPNRQGVLRHRRDAQAAVAGAQGGLHRASA